MINYTLLTKPKILAGNLLTVAAGFFLASRREIDLLLFLATFVGMGLIMASACVFNNMIDRQIDSRMERTKRRPLVVGSISIGQALLFGITLGLLGNLVLLRTTNLLTVGVADSGFIVYVVLYSLWKCRTIYGTAIGSIAGAVPPVVGYCAVSNHLDLAALLLFGMLVLWQMPHFFSIALLHMNDYTAAGIPVLPIEKGILRTKIHMAVYIAVFLAIALLLPFFGYTGTAFLFVTLATGLIWLFLSLKGFRKGQNDQLWSRQMFRWSLVLITAVCSSIILS